MRKIYLIRHGMPLFDFQDQCCIGQAEYQLSLIGRQQIEKAKIFLLDKCIHKVFCSPLQRCRSSAEIISGGIIPVLEADGLKEINMGEWDGMPFSEIREKHPNEYKLRGNDFGGFMPPGGESFTMCQRRAVKTFKEILEDTVGNIVIVAHAGVNRTILCHLDNMDLNKILSIKQPYGCINIITENNGNYLVEKTGYIPEDEV